MTATPVVEDVERPRATVKEIKEYFGEQKSVHLDGTPVSWIGELKDLKASPSKAGHATGYDDIAYGLVDGTLTY
jgi:hypothetical protein